MVTEDNIPDILLCYYNLNLQQEILDSCSLAIRFFSLATGTVVSLVKSKKYPVTNTAVATTILIFITSPGKVGKER